MLQILKTSVSEWQCFCSAKWHSSTHLGTSYQCLLLAMASKSDLKGIGT